MNSELSQEDRAILRTLDRLGTEDPLDSPEIPMSRLDAAGGVPPYADGASDDTLQREFLELLSLLPFELESTMPSPGVRQRILARTAPQAARVLKLPDREVGDLTLVGARARTPEVATVDQTLLRSTSRDPAGDEPPAAAVPAPSRRRRSWFVPASLAAALVLCLVGLGYLAGRVSEQNATIVRLSENLRSSSALAAALEMRQDELFKIEKRFRMITTVARQAYPLRPMPAVAREYGQMPPPTGMVWVCGRHQQWYLNLQGIAPPPEGNEYHLWFITDHGTIAGGVLDVSDRATAELEAPSMPEGTRGFAVTLEKSGPHNQPDGRYVLLGDSAVSL